MTKDVEHYVEQWVTGARTACGIESKAHSSTTHIEDVTCQRCIRVKMAEQNRPS
jgi:hypothetical protein